MALAEVPFNSRGSVRFGRNDQLWHFIIDTRGELSIAPGPDTRDWAALDRGALDYSRIAAQEHAIGGQFDGHVGGAGGKVGQACAVCAAAPTIHVEGHPDIIVAAAQRIVDAKKAGHNMGKEAAPAPVTPAETVGPVPEHLTPEVAAQILARQTERDNAEKLAAAEYEAKLALSPDKATTRDLQDENRSLRETIAALKAKNDADENALIVQQQMRQQQELVDQLLAEKQAREPDSSQPAPRGASWGTTIDERCTQHGMTRDQMTHWAREQGNLPSNGRITHHTLDLYDAANPAQTVVVDNNPT